MKIIVVEPTNLKFRQHEGTFIVSSMQLGRKNDNHKYLSKLSFIDVTYIRDDIRAKEATTQMQLLRHFSLQKPIRLGIGIYFALQQSST